MPELEIVGVHGASVLKDGTPNELYANRLDKGVELLEENTTDYLALLGGHAESGLKYIQRKYNVSDRKIQIESRGKSTLQETKYFKKLVSNPDNNYKNIGGVSQIWHLYPRIDILYDYFFPSSKDYKFKLFEAEDSKDEPYVIKLIRRERKAKKLDKLRMSLGRIGTSDAVQDLVESIVQRKLSKSQSLLVVLAGIGLKYSTTAIRTITEQADIGLLQNPAVYLYSNLAIPSNMLEKFLIEPLAYYLTGAAIRGRWGNNWKDYLINSFIGFGVHGVPRALTRLHYELNGGVWVHGDIPAEPFTLLPISAGMAAVGSLIPYIVKAVKKKSSSKEVKSNN